MILRSEKECISKRKYGEAEMIGALQQLEAGCRIVHKIQPQRVRRIVQ